MNPIHRFGIAFAIMMVGIWHPYAVSVSPKTAAAIGTLAGIGAMFYTISDTLL